MKTLAKLQINEIFSGLFQDPVDGWIHKTLRVPYVSTENEIVVLAMRSQPGKPRLIPRKIFSSLIMEFVRRVNWGKKDFFCSLGYFSCLRMVLPQGKLE